MRLLVCLLAFAPLGCGSPPPVLLGDGAADLAAADLASDGGGLVPLDLAKATCNGNSARGNVSGQSISTRPMQNGALFVNNVPVITISDWMPPGNVCTGAQPTGPAWSIVLKPNGGQPGTYTVGSGGSAATYYEVPIGMPARPYDGISGTIQITTTTGNFFQGTFDITFSTGGLADGCFAVPTC